MLRIHSFITCFLSITFLMLLFSCGEASSPAENSRNLPTPAPVTASSIPVTSTNTHIDSLAAPITTAVPDFITDTVIVKKHPTKSHSASSKDNIADDFPDAHPTVTTPEFTYDTVIIKRPRIKPALAMEEAEKTEPVASQSQNKKRAVLGYSYFSHMMQDETRNIYAYVLAVNKNSNVNRLIDSIVTDLKEVNSQIKAERRSDTASYFTKTNIFFYKYLTITLNDPGNNFQVDSLGIPARQLIDTLECNQWQWAVTPKTSTKQPRLIIKVAAEREDGSQKLIDTREIAVNIQLDIQWWREVWTWLMNNPEKSLVLILIPLAAYFGKKIFDRKKSKPE